ncbi:hypothetical protein CDL15_Pgr027400 [Punica granatum]|nr:hypothetical protein CDL15_Pgr027400 [Punica granatum]
MLQKTFTKTNECPVTAIPAYGDKKIHLPCKQQELLTAKHQDPIDSSELLGSSTAQPDARMDDECIRLATESRGRPNQVRSRTSKLRKETSGPCSGRCLDGNTSDDSTRCRSKSPIQQRGLLAAGDCTLSMLPPARYTPALEENVSNGNTVGFGMPPPPKECTLNAPNNQGANSNSANPNTQEASQCPDHDRHN